MRFSRLSTALSLSTALLAGFSVSGCNYGKINTDDAAPISAGEANRLNPEQSRTFAKEAIAMKSRYPDPQEYDNGIRGLFARYHLPVPAPRGNAFSPLIPDILPDPIASGNGQPVAAKTAALAAIWKKVKSFDITFPYALLEVIDLPNNAVMSAWTAQIDATVDPYLVAFYAPGGDWNMGTVNIIALDDDGAGFPNAYMTWRNNTGSTQEVILLAFGYSASTSGRAQLNTTSASGGPISTITGTIAAYRTFDNDNISTTGCTGPGASRLEFKRLDPNSGFYGTGLLGVNRSTMTGVSIWELNDMRVNFNEVLAPTGGNFVIPYLRNEDGMTYPFGNHYGGWQEDKYSCNFP